MIKYTTTHILKSDADALVVPVNTVGVMGAGLAKAFARQWPDLELAYAIQCAQERLTIGTLYFWDIPGTARHAICFPTKRHWRDPSQLSYIETGLCLFVEYYDAFGIHSASFPQLGCGLGGLQWDQVRPLMEQYLAALPIQVRIHIIPTR